MVMTFYYFCGKSNIKFVYRTTLKKTIYFQISSSTSRSPVNKIMQPSYSDALFRCNREFRIRQKLLDENAERLRGFLLFMAELFQQLEIQVNQITFLPGKHYINFGNRKVTQSFPLPSTPFPTLRCVELEGFVGRVEIISNCGKLPNPTNTAENWPRSRPFLNSITNFTQWLHQARGSPF